MNKEEAGKFTYVDDDPTEPEIDFSEAVKALYQLTDQIIANCLNSAYSTSTLPPASGERSRQLPASIIPIAEKCHQQTVAIIEKSELETEKPGSNSSIPTSAFPDPRALKAPSIPKLTDFPNPEVTDENIYAAIQQRDLDLMNKVVYKRMIDNYLSIVQDYCLDLKSLLPDEAVHLDRNFQHTLNLNHQHLQIKHPNLYNKIARIANLFRKLRLQQIYAFCDQHKAFTPEDVFLILKPKLRTELESILND